MIYKTDKPPMNDKRYQSCFEYMFVLSKGMVKTFNPIMEKSKHAGRKTYGTYRNQDGSLKQQWADVGVKEYKVKENIWYFAGEASNGHPAPFPEALARDHILSWSNPGDVVLDCFCGSGTTPKMAKILGREYIGIEVSAEYIHLAERRLLATNPPLFAGAGYNTASTPTGGSDTVTGLLSQPEDLPANGHGATPAAPCQ